MNRRPVKMLAVADIEHFRRGGRCPLGWQLEPKVATGRAVCRCCGERIARGETAMSVFLSFSGNYASYCTQEVFLHEACSPCGGVERYTYSR